MKAMNDTDTVTKTSITKSRGLRGLGRVYLRGRLFWIEFGHRGRMFRESSGSARESDARKLLKQRLHEIGRGRFVGPSEQRVLLTDLLDAVKVDYTTNGRRSLPILEYRLAQLRRAFDGERALDLTEDRISRYTAARLDEGYKPASVNRELAVLRRAYKLGIRHKRISSAPSITLLREDNARQGFVEPATFETIAAHLPEPPLADAARFAYSSGWRKNEVLTLLWSDVDRARGLVTLRREHSKTSEPRVLAMPTGSALAALVERRWNARTVTRADGTTGVSAFVFHQSGQPIGSFRKTWASACRAAGVPGLLFHDLRRSAIRNMIRGGVDPVVAMKISGHRTRSIFDRYNIVDERDQRDALAKVEAFVAGDHTRTVVPMKRRAELGS